MAVQTSPPLLPGRLQARPILRHLGDGLAGIIVVAYVAASLGLVQWDAIGRATGGPWDTILNDQIAPKTIRIVLLLAIAWLVGRAVSYVLDRPPVRTVVGDGSLVLLRRLLALLAWPALATMGLFMMRVNPNTALANACVHGDGVIVSLPVSSSIVVFAACALALPPNPARAYFSARWARVVDALPFVVSLSLIYAASKVFTPQPCRIVPPNFLDSWLAQLGMMAFEMGIILLVWEVGRAAWADLQAARQGGRRRLALVAVRGLLLQTLLLGPLVCGVLWGLFCQPPAASMITDRNGELLAVYRPQGPLRIHAFPGEVAQSVNLFVDATEDPGVYAYPGAHVPLNLVRVIGSINGSANGDESGASGVASQICKQISGRPLSSMASSLPGYGLTRVPTTIAQKVLFEFPCAWALERSSRLLGPERLMNLYLNLVLMGNDAYGVQAASHVLFGKPARDLQPAEAALIAGLPQGPNLYDPWSNPDDTWNRRHQVVTRALAEGYLGQADADAIDAAPLVSAKAPVEPRERAVPFLRHEVVPWLDRNRQYDQRRLSVDGLNIRSSLDLALEARFQQHGEAVLRRLAEKGANDFAAVVLDPRTGEVLVWIANRAGGAPGEESPDVAGEAVQQPGSAIKPFVYACARLSGVLGAGEWLDDSPRLVGGYYIADHDLASRGMIPWQQALRDSRNVPAAELVDRMTPAGFAACLRDVFGFTADLHPDEYGVKMGIGLMPVPLVDLARGLAILASGGSAAPAAPILSIQSRDRRDLYRQPNAQGEPRLSCQVAGEVRAPLVAIAQTLGFPDGTAVKTGSTPSSSFAAAYAPDVVVVVWLGHSEPGYGRMAIPQEILGKDGGVVIVNRFLSERYAGVQVPAFAACEP